jgi:hypothetical protein
VFALAPAAAAAIALLPASRPQATYGWCHSRPGAEPELVVGPPYELPWLPPSRVLRRGARGRVDRDLDACPHAARSCTGERARARERRLPARLGHRPQRRIRAYWAYQGGYLWLVTIVPLLVAVALARRAGRIQGGKS